MTNYIRINGYENYLVSSKGEVINEKTSHILKPFVGTGGYLYVTLSKDGKGHPKRLHRLVAEAFCLRRIEATEVNHKNGDKTDNRANNLEWVTKSENMNHAYRNGLQKSTHKGKVRSVVCLNDGKYFGTISEASEYYGVSKSQIYWCCRRESKRCKLKFRFAKRQTERSRR